MLRVRRETPLSHSDHWLQPEKVQSTSDSQSRCVPNGPQQRRDRKDNVAAAAATETRAHEATHLISERRAGGPIAARQDGHAARAELAAEAAHAPLRPGRYGAVHGHNTGLGLLQLRARQAVLARGLGDVAAANLLALDARRPAAPLADNAVLLGRCARVDPVSLWAARSASVPCGTLAQLGLSPLEGRVREGAKRLQHINVLCARRSMFSRRCTGLGLQPPTALRANVRVHVAGQAIDHLQVRGRGLQVARLDVAVQTTRQLRKQLGSRANLAHGKLARLALGPDRRCARHKGR
jgi:hypothetical protein